MNEIIMKRIFLLTTVFLFSAFLLKAQTIDPTVEVSRSYEGKLMEVHKPALTMAVPDSVLKFDLDFDYSVFDSPYKGSYEFNPYVTSMRPADSKRPQDTFWLRAGAGYTLHPVLDVVWSPAFRKSFSMDIYALHRSYVGDYRSVGPVLDSDGRINEVQSLDPVSGYGLWKGYDMLTRSGIDVHWDWRKSRLDVGAGYYGLHRTALGGVSGSMNAFDFSAGFSSKPYWPSHMKYRVDLDYRVAKDVMSTADAADGYLNEHDVKIYASFGPESRSPGSVFVDVSMMTAAYSGYFDTSISEFAFIPHYVYRHGRVKVDAGLRLAKLMRGDGYVTMYKTREQFVYPDIRLDVEALKDLMMVYLRIGGGNKVNTYSSLLESNHHIMMNSTFGHFPLLDTTVERVSLIMGAEGRVASVFSYDLRFGYVNYKNALVDAVWLQMPETLYEEAGFMAGVGYAPYKKWLAALDLRYSSEEFKAEATFDYTSAWGEDFTSDAASGLLRPAALKGDVSVGYVWRNRVHASVDCAFSTARKGYVPAVPERNEVYEAFVPGYADLGLNAGYDAGSRLTFWLRVGNILDMPVMYNPLYAEKGINFTAGVCLNFQ